jgi:hypothetical protein
MVSVKCDIKRQTRSNRIVASNIEKETGNGNAFAHLGSR